MNHSDRFWSAAVGALQGLLLLATHEAVQGQLWPATEPAFLVGWYALLVGVPVAVELLLRPHGRRLAGFALVLGVVLLGLGLYAGYVADAAGGSRAGHYGAFGVSVAVIWFVALPFAAIWIRSGRFYFPYTELFEHAWANTLTLGLAAFFTGIFWALLGLWAGLFKVIGVNHFADLFTSRPFIYLATGTAFGLAVHLGRSHSGAVATIRKVTLATYRGLLPMLAAFALLFLAFLPFTGLEPLWNTGHAAALLLGLQFAVILFLNAAYQDGNVEPPYAAPVRQMVNGAVLLLPVYGALTLYALYLRVAQHGWSAQRVWAVVLAVIAALYALGYMAAALARSARWLGPMGRVNVGMALLVMVVLAAANTPLLDPYRIGVASQVERLLSGRVTPQAFDYRYLRFDGGRHGMEALRTLADHPGDDAVAVAIRKGAGVALAMQNRWEEAPATKQIAEAVTIYPRGRSLDPEFAAYLNQTKVYGITSKCGGSATECWLLAVDLNGDGRDEYVQPIYPYLVFARGAEGWRQLGRLEPNGATAPTPRADALEAARISTFIPGWRGLQIGAQQFVVVEVPAVKGAE